MLITTDKLHYVPSKRVQNHEKNVFSVNMFYSIILCEILLEYFNIFNCIPKFCRILNSDYYFIFCCKCLPHHFLLFILKYTPLQHVCKLVLYYGLKYIYRLAMQFKTQFRIKYKAIFHKILTDMYAWSYQKYCKLLLI